MLDETGLRTVFHHHCAGYVETPDEIARFLDLTDPRYVGLVFDTGHYVYGAGDARCRGRPGALRRPRLVHAFQGLPPGVAALARSHRWDYFTALRHGVFCELGKGWVDFPAVLRWLKSKRYSGYVLVEQDILPGMGTPKRKRAAESRVSALDRTLLRVSGPRCRAG